MKRPRIIATALAVMAVALLAGRAMGSIGGSKHDFADPKQYPTNWSNGQICAPCHAPHNTTPTATDGGELSGPLWNHTLPTNSYKMYISTDIKDANGNKLYTAELVTAGQQVDTNSILCLSCHDGTVALDSFGGTSATAGTSVGPISGNANFGNDLSNDHPIGAAAIWTDVSYMVPQSARDAAGIMPIRKMADGSKAVGCTSCHEPHNRKSTKHMLWVANDQAGTTVDGRSVTGSVLCLNCHKK